MDIIRPRGAVVVVPLYFLDDLPRRSIARRLLRSLRGQVVLGIGSEGRMSRNVFSNIHPRERYIEYVQSWDPRKDESKSGGSADLRRKFDFGIQCAKQYNPATVWLVGSDDFMVPEFFQRPRQPGAGLVVCGGGTYLWDKSKLLSSSRYFEHPAPAELRHTGGPLGFSVDYLARVGWRPFQRPGCEYGAERLAEEMGETIEVRPDACWTVRCATVLNEAQAMVDYWPNRRTTPAEIDDFGERWASYGPSK